MQTPLRVVALGLLEKFPDAGSLTLAKMVFKQYPLLFKSVGSARDVFRHLRGARGKHTREHCTDKTHYREPQKPGDPFGHTIPAGKTHFENWEALQINGPLRALVLSDIHYPYHDRSALLAALEEGQKQNVDTVLLNGDAFDFFSVSFWEKDPTKRNLKAEVEGGQELLKAIRGLFPKARIIFKDGNHEERWERYLTVKAPELCGMEYFGLPAIMKFADAGIETHVSEKRPIRLGELNVLHGHEYRFAIGNPVNAARGLYLRAKAHALCGHFHQRSEHSEKSVEQSKIATWSTGCLCEMHPEYAPLNNWSHGFAIVDVAKDGKFQVQNKFIAGGKVY